MKTDSKLPAPTAKFRRQHQELAALASTLEQKLDGAHSREGATEVRHLLAQFAGKLGVHLRMEDEALYPRLAAARDPHVQQTAKALLSEIGNVHEEFRTFLSAWPSARSIEANPRAFATQCSQVMRVIARRIEREEADLYPLLDGLG